MGCSCITHMGPKSNDKCSYKRLKRKRYRQRTRHVKTEAENGVMWPQSKGHLQPPEAGRAKEVFSPRAFGRSTALPTPQFWTFGPLNREKINICCFKFMIICYKPQETNMSCLDKISSTFSSWNPKESLDLYAYD